MSAAELHLVAGIAAGQPIGGDLREFQANPPKVGPVPAGPPIGPLSKHTGDDPLEPIRAAIVDAVIDGIVSGMTARYRST